MGDFDPPIDTLASYVAAMANPPGIDEAMPPTFWFRGHADISYELLPGILRAEVRERVCGYTQQIPTIKLRLTTWE